MKAINNMTADSCRVNQQGEKHNSEHTVRFKRELYCKSIALGKVGKDRDRGLVFKSELTKCKEERNNRGKGISVIIQRYSKVFLLMPNKLPVKQLKGQQEVEDDLNANEIQQ